METFAKRFKELREEKGLNQTQLAKELGFSSRTISSYETGRGESDFQTLTRLCKFFDVTAGYLIGIEEF
ncbi:MAG: helix-turn-helix domain-containing protein [Firmicutes bacterium]|nr:helix-turn-helix domain-containing protein [Bacillota bacterium]